MPSIKNWWAGEIEWATPAGQLLQKLTGHPTAGEFKLELQNAVDLFRPAFDEDSPNRYPENTRKLWRELFHAEIDIRREIIEPAVARRRQGYGETPPDYKGALGQ